MKHCSAPKLYTKKGLVENNLNKSDLPVIMGTVIVIASLFIVINIFVDILYGWLDPKIGV